MNTRWITLTMAALSIGAVVYASPRMIQQHHGGGQHGAAQQHHEHMMKVAEQLNLAEAQKQQIHEILGGFHQNMKSLHEDKNADKVQMAERMRNLTHQVGGQILQTLNRDQVKKLEGMGGIGIFIGQAMDPVAMLAKLGLNDRQMSEAKRIVGETHSKMLQLHQSDLNETRKQAAAKELHESTIRRIESLLNAEQRTKLKQLLEAHHGKGG